MNRTEKLTLIGGTFSNDEARDILVNIFFSKINFHKSKNFSSREQFGKDDLIAGERIPALTKELEKLQQILCEAKLKNKMLKVSSEIVISFLDD